MFRSNIIFCILIVTSVATHAMEHDGKKSEDFLVTQPVNLVSSNLDDLVLQGVQHIKDHGSLFQARAGSGQQAFDVSYTLTNPRNRVHNLRAPAATKYLAREFLAYFNGSLKVDEGLGEASKMWTTLANDKGEICSNYGHYVFHQRVPSTGKTQYEWVIDNLKKSRDSRKAFININQLQHKDMDSKDFPCTLGMQFFVKQNHLCCSVASRSTDIFTGLPYDMGFFSFVTELVYKDLKRQSKEQDPKLKLGYVTMKTQFTQIYDATRTKALKMLEDNTKKERPAYATDMPKIHDAQATLKDIYEKTDETPVMKWVHKHAALTKKRSAEGN